MYRILVKINERWVEVSRSESEERVWDGITLDLPYSFKLVCPDGVEIAL